MGENVIIKVKLFGGFGMEINNEPITLRYPTSSKLMQLLICVLLAGETGVRREVLIKRLYQEEATDPATSLRVGMHRLRGYLKTLPGLEDADCIYQKKGVFFWNYMQIPVEIDTVEFEKLLTETAEDKKREDNLFRALELYDGEFLPELAADEWAAIENSNCQSRYLEGVSELWECVREHGDYRRFLHIIERACRLFHYEEHYVIYISCLIEIGETKVALSVYHEISNYLLEEHGVKPSEQLLEVFRILSDEVKINTMDIDEARVLMEESERGNGGYYCSYPGFVDCYRSTCRAMSRTGYSAFLLTAILVDNTGMPKEDATLEEIEDARLAIGASIRSGDVYAKCSPGQFMILLLGLTLEDCKIVEKRMMDNFKKLGKYRRTRLRFQERPAEEPAIQ